MTTTEAARNFPEKIAAIQAGADIPCGGGETFAEMRARVPPASETSRLTWPEASSPEVGRPASWSRMEGRSVLRVAHLLDLPAGGHRLIDPPANCSITTVDLVLDSCGEVDTSRLVEHNAGPAADPAAGGKRHGLAQDAVGER